MSVDILMPALSPTMEEGTLSKWLKKEGDAVKSGDIIAEIETDKATMEVEAVDEGILSRIVVPEGTEGVKVNAVIAVLASDGEDVPKSGPKAEASPARAGRAEARPPSERRMDNWVFRPIRSSRAACRLRTYLATSGRT